MARSRKPDAHSAFRGFSHVLSWQRFSRASLTLWNTSIRCPSHTDALRMFFDTKKPKAVLVKRLQTTHLSPREGYTHAARHNRECARETLLMLGIDQHSSSRHELSRSDVTFNSSNMARAHGNMSASLRDQV